MSQEKLVNGTESVPAGPRPESRSGKDRSEELNAERERLAHEFWSVRDRFLAYARGVAHDAGVDPETIAAMPDFDGSSAGVVTLSLALLFRWMERVPREVADTLKSGLGRDFTDACRAFADRDRDLQFAIMNMWAEKDAGTARALELAGKKHMTEEEAYDEAMLMRARLRETGIPLDELTAEDYKRAERFLEKLAAQARTESPDDTWVYKALNVLLAPSESALKGVRTGIDAVAAKILVLAPLLKYASDVWLGETIRAVSLLRTLESAADRLRRLELIAQEEELTKADNVKILEK